MTRWMLILALVVAPATCLAAEATSQPAPAATAELNDGIRRLLRTSSQAPQEQDEGAAALQRAIEQLRSIEIAPKRQPQAATQPAAMPGARATTQPGRQPSDAASDPIVLATLRRLGAGRAVDPVLVADELFADGQLEVAGAFYEAALLRSQGDDDLAWALFQLGNCRRKSDPLAAKQAYTELAAKCPDCPWAQAAAMRLKLIEWAEVNKPLDALAEAKSAVRNGAARPRPQTQPAKENEPAAASGTEGNTVAKR